jgi:hypothetical protein
MEYIIWKSNLQKFVGDKEDTLFIGDAKVFSSKRDAKNYAEKIGFGDFWLLELGEWLNQATNF